MFKVVLLLTAISGTLAITNYSKCSKGETPESVVINLCDEAPCIFYKGDQVVANTIIIAPYNSTIVTANLDFIFAGIRTKYPLPPDVVDACAHLTPDCPIIQGTRYEYTFDMVIEEIPVGGVRVTMEIQAKDDDNNIAICISFPATVYTTPRPQEG